MSKLDHIVWACRDLDEGMQSIEVLTGVRPQKGGHHPGNGTCNAMISLGDMQYLEILAPDPNQPLSGTSGEMLSKLKVDGILTFCMNKPNLEHQAGLVSVSGLQADGPNDWSRDLPDGKAIHWRLLMVEGHSFGYYIPFFIDWMKCTHPSTVTPDGVRLLSFEIGHPDLPNLSGLFKALEIDCPLSASEQPSFKAVLQGPTGQVTLTSVVL